ncbi:MAG TPA: DUF542 domain-containing protein [Gemmatimonadaceae bacterium]|nr:DUF542 domain-containing protein [Gemmatimonadaceae bacterium]
MPKDAAPLDATCTVNQMMARDPRAIEVFNRFGVDTCCGSGATIAEAARRDGIDEAELLAELRKALAAE